MLECQKKIHSLVEEAGPIWKAMHTPNPDIKNWKKPETGMQIESRGVTLNFSPVTESNGNFSMTFSIYSKQCEICATKSNDTFKKCFMANIYKGK